MWWKDILEAHRGRGIRATSPVCKLLLGSFGVSDAGLHGHGNLKNNREVACRVSGPQLENASQACCGEGLFEPQGLGSSPAGATPAPV